MQRNVEKFREMQRSAEKCRETQPEPFFFTTALTVQLPLMFLSLDGAIFKSHQGEQFGKKYFCAKAKKEKIIFVNSTIFSHIFSFLCIIGQLLILKISRIAS